MLLLQSVTLLLITFASGDDDDASTSTFDDEMTNSQCFPPLFIVTKRNSCKVGRLVFRGGVLTLRDVVKIIV